MAEKIVSPGVFTNEKDLSFLPAGIAAIGAAIVGPTKKGPAFVPTVIESFDEFIAQFGGLSENTYVPYAVKSYLNAASTVTVVRVLQEGGYNAKAVHIVHSGSLGYKLVGVILPTKMSPLETSAPILIIPSSSKFFNFSSLIFGISLVITSGPSLVSRTSMV